jgi:hypothetical protein
MANLYQVPSHVVNTKASAVSGRFLAHNHLSPVEHAFMADDLFMGTTQLVLPTMTQAAALARVNVTYAWAAHKRRAKRTDIETGLIPLVPPRLVAPKPNGAAVFVPQALDIDEPTLIRIARTVGAERMLAAAVAAEAVQ